MSLSSNVTEKDLINLRNLADQQKNQRALKIKNRNLKQTHDVKLAESLSQITKKLDEVNETTKNLGEIFIKSDVEDGNRQTPVMKKIFGKKSLRDTLTLMKKGKNFFKLQDKPDGNVFWNKIPIIALGEKKISFNDDE